MREDREPTLSEVPWHSVAGSGETPASSNIAGCQCPSQGQKPFKGHKKNSSSDMRSRAGD